MNILNLLGRIFFNFSISFWFFFIVLIILFSSLFSKYFSILFSAFINSDNIIINESLFNSIFSPIYLKAPSSSKVPQKSSSWHFNKFLSMFSFTFSFVSFFPFLFSWLVDICPFFLSFSFKFFFSSFFTLVLSMSFTFFSIFSFLNLYISFIFSSNTLQKNNILGNCFSLLLSNCLVIKSNENNSHDKFIKNFSFWRISIFLLLTFSSNSNSSKFFSSVIVELLNDIEIKVLLYIKLGSSISEFIPNKFITSLSFICNNSKRNFLIFIICLIISGSITVYIHGTLYI